jgi:predicted transcriptional regulator
MELKVLEDIGLSQNEAKVYLTLLEIGMSTAGEAAKKVKLHRTNVYDALQRLVEKGLVSYIVRLQTKYFEAAPPKDLLRFIKEKEERLSDSIAQMELLAECNEKKGQTHLYEGVKAFMNINYGWLRYKAPICVFGTPPRNVSMALECDIPKWHTKRIAEKVVMRHIYLQKDYERIKLLNSMPFTEAGYLPGDWNPNMTTAVCGDEVVLYFWDKPITIIQIINPIAAKTYIQFFDYLWTQVKKDV